MEYTVKKLADLSGVTPRTIRYYDEIDLLQPKKISSSGYRLYSEREVDRLQQILFYRAFDINLNSIKEIMDSKDFDEINVLKNHRKNIITRKNQLELLLENLDKTIISKERGLFMNDSEKFKGFKEELIGENEKKYGKEIREKYGVEAIEESNKKFKNMTEEENSEATLLEKRIKELLKETFVSNDPSGPLAQEIADLHKQLLNFYWTSYSKEAHANLAKMYVLDDRFKSYYDEEQTGIAEFLRDAILIYTNKN